LAKLEKLKTEAIVSVRAPLKETLIARVLLRSKATGSLIQTLRITSRGKSGIAEDQNLYLDFSSVKLYDPSVKVKTQKQVAYLLSKVSPLTGKEQGKLKKELHSGAVKIKSKAK
jgi:hypothetical protein